MLVEPGPRLISDVSMRSPIAANACYAHSAIRLYFGVDTRKLPTKYLTLLQAVIILQEIGQTGKQLFQNLFLA